MQSLLKILRRHKAGDPIGIYSVCSAHPLVLEAAIRLGARENTPVLIEATSNQVNQEGGYTGLTPDDFYRQVSALAERYQLPRQHLLLGGDHLGPNCWTHLDAKEAMQRSEQLIESYIEAGFRKIHLDCSFRCADDPERLSDQVMARRAARLCRVAEDTWQRCGGEAPVYVIGTEVPVPGGADESLDGTLEVTGAQAAAATIDLHQSAFAAAGLDVTWPRVIALVVQPGVEFDHHKVIAYQPQAAQPLARQIGRYSHLVYEAHSTDYQSPRAYRQLVRDHFAILKVGPALTFALREALFALDSIEQELLGNQASGLKQTLERVMCEEPGYWQSYYRGGAEQEQLDRRYSLSDRIRYYWGHPEVQRVQQRLFENLTQHQPPLTLLSQYLPQQLQAIQRGELTAEPRELVIHKVMEALMPYQLACFQGEVA
ncbi:D-tagatose-bisphosphate aldolase, class II, non-catalytic subunit [Dongshaea marina]|uniref:D-tagatose-bisphosphate aldolase, class II, non-catalytic subunit n=1 Tax=Dongshaea marina TaxID=2047966 RepID=UPI000D3EA420|nr:D-tagatose-bisphosphate aldolase, class II, non-catalytic subunit [Dongshaea marina]